MEAIVSARALETYAVFDPGDPFHASICRGEEQLREIIGQFDCPNGLIVKLITDARDVSDDFISDDIDDAPVGPSPDSLSRWYNTQVL